jgi:hypothetical protein
MKRYIVTFMRWPAMSEQFECVADNEDHAKNLCLQEMRRQGYKDESIVIHKVEEKV